MAQVIMVLEARTGLFHIIETPWVHDTDSNYRVSIQDAVNFFEMIIDEIVKIEKQRLENRNK